MTTTTHTTEATTLIVPVADRAYIEISNVHTFSSEPRNVWFARFFADGEYVGTTESFKTDNVQDAKRRVLNKISNVVTDTDGRYDGHYTTRELDFMVRYCEA